MNAIDQLFLRIGRIIVDAVEGVATATGLPTFVPTLVAMLLPVVAVVAFFPAFFAYLTWQERKLLARVQNRYGPNRVGPFGLFQPIADGMKMMTKEDIIPRSADKLLHTLGPILIVAPSLVLFSLLPFGRGMTPADVDVSVLLFFAMGSLSTIALFVAGWGSRNKYSLLGAMRAIAQMISYEMPLVMAAVPVVMMTGSMAVSKIVLAQGPAEPAFLESVTAWNIWTPWGVVGFLTLFVAGMAELNRSPFDLSEGESEIVAGFHTEYSGMKFALFFLAEYLSAIAFSGLAATLYLGGWQGPAFLPSWLWLFAKMFLLLTLMMWIRATLPRLRVDQLMSFSWKFLLPLTLVNIFATGMWHYVAGPALWQKALGWVVGAAILVPAYLLLARANAGPATQKRQYRYANL